MQTSDRDREGAEAGDCTDFFVALRAGNYDLGDLRYDPWLFATIKADYARIMEEERSDWRAF